MIEIPSRLTNTITNYVYARKQLGGQGFIVGGNWDYQQGYFDYLMDDGNKSNCIRIPFTAIKGSIEDKNGVIRFGTPYLLSYEAKAGTQFYTNSLAEECNADFSLDSSEYVDSGLERYMDLGRALVNEAENVFLGNV